MDTTLTQMRDKWDDENSASALEDKCAEIERVLIEVGTVHRFDDINGPGRSPDSHSLHCMIADRKAARAVSQNK